MKKLFVIHDSINNIKNQESQEILSFNNKKNFEKNNSSIKFGENQANITNPIQSTIFNSSSKSRNFSLNIPTTEPSSPFNLNTPSDSNTEKNEFLGKKIKLQFNIVKEENTKSNNIQSLDEKEIKNSEKNYFLKIGNSTDIKIIKKNNRREKRLCLKEGRWSFDEHIKFIEALVKYGKNWKYIQNYVGTRSTSQVRSHAQKFLLKLKMIKNSNLVFDFANNNIKNLSHVIREIKQKKKNNIDENVYIINTLISLSKTISNENNELNQNIRKFRKFKKDQKIKKEENQSNYKLNNDKNELCANNYGVFINNESNQIELKEPEIKEESEEKKITHIENVNEVKYSNLNENNLTKDENKLLIKEEITKLIEDDPLENNDCFNISNKQLCFDDDIAFYLDDLEFINYNNNSLREKNYYYNIFFESMINKQFFS